MTQLSAVISASCQTGSDFKQPKLRATDLRPASGPTDARWLRSSDFPQFEHWSPEKVQAAAPLLDQNPAEHDDPNLEAILLVVYHWITIAAARNDALFGFIY